MLRIMSSRCRGRGEEAGKGRVLKSHYLPWAGLNIVSLLEEGERLAKSFLDFKCLPRFEKMKGLQIDVWPTDHGFYVLDPNAIVEGQQKKKRYLSTT